MLGKLRAAVKPVVRAVAAPLVRAGVSPHTVTLSAIPLAVLAAICMNAHAYHLAFVAALLAALADLLDGTVAELQNRRTPFGNYLEAVVDKIVEVILLLGAAQAFPLAAGLACGTSLLVSYAKARVGLVIVADNRDWHALGDRADRLLVLLVGLLFGRVQFALLLIAGMNVIGLVQRMRFARALIADAERDGTLLPYLLR